MLKFLSTWLLNDPLCGIYTLKSQKLDNFNYCLCHWDSKWSAYVYIRSGNIWSLQSKLLPDNVGVSDGFGRSVSISDGSIVVGENCYEVIGSVYVYKIVT